jgi:hypothetical protein
METEVKSLLRSSFKTNLDTTDGQGGHDDYAGRL